LKIDIQPPILKCAAASACELEFDVTVLFYGGSIDDFIPESNFEAVVMKGDNGESVHVKSARCQEDEQKCRLTLDIPVLDPGEYDIILNVASPSISSPVYSAQDSVSLNVVVPFMGTLLDASGNPIQAKIILTNLDSGETKVVNTDSSGKYYSEILPGNYDIELQFSGGIDLRFTRVEVGTSEVATMLGDIFRFDMNHLNSELPKGVRNIETVVVEFALPFKRMWARVPYDSGRVTGDEAKLRTYVCDSWNFKRSVCNTEWENIGGSIDKIRDSVSFNASFDSAAYMVAEQEWVHITDLKISKKTVYMGEAIEVSGRVLDSNGVKKPGVLVSLILPEFSLSEKTLTDEDGQFTLFLNAPYESGPTEIKVEVSGDLYVPYSVTDTINIIKKEEMRLVGLQDTYDVRMGREFKIPFSLSNTGQTNISDVIYVSLSGISNEWYTISPTQISGLGMGDNQQLDLTINIDPNSCRTQCKQYYLISINAKSESLEATQSFTIKILTPSNETKKSTKQSAVKPKSKSGGVTAFFSTATTGMGSNSIYIILLATLFGLVFLTYRKRTVVRHSKRRTTSLGVVYQGSSSLGSFGKRSSLRRL